MGPDHLSKSKFKGLLSFLVLFSACKQTRSVFKTLFILFFGYQALAQHPRLYVTTQRINELRSAIEVNGSHHKDAYLAKRYH